MIQPAEDSKYALLRRNMIAVVVAVSAAPLFLINAVLIYHYHVVYKDMVRERFAQMAVSRAGGVDANLGDKLKMLGFLAASYSLDELSRPEVLEGCLSRLKTRFPGSFEDLGLVDPAGRMAAYAGRHAQPGADYRDAPWFTRALAQPETVSDVFLGLRNIPHFLVTVRLDSPSGPYVLRATADLAGFAAMLGESRAGRGDAALVINTRGTVQAATAGAPELPQAVTAEILSRDLSRHAAFAFEYEGPGGRDDLYAASGLNLADWVLVLRQDADVALAQLGNARIQSAIVVAAGIMGIVLMAVLLSARMVERLAASEREQQAMRDKIVETGKLASIGELAAGVAHEINNPVAIMVEEAGWIGDLVDDGAVLRAGTEAEIRAALAEITTQGKRCREITHNLLSFARKTEGKVAPADVGRVVAEIAGLARQKAKFAGVALTVASRDDLPEICLSVSEMQQILLNLINNAIDAVAATGRTDGLVTVGVEGRERTVVIEVTDNGGGIAPEAAERIFDPFFTTKGPGEGTGLGLSICHGLVAKLGGEITVHSEPGRGTTFSVILPVPGPCPEKSPEQS